MGFLENLGRKHSATDDQLRRVPTRRLKLWVWFLPCAAAFLPVVIIMTGHVAVGLLLLIPVLISGGFSAWVRFQQVAPIIDERQNPGPVANQIRGRNRQRRGGRKRRNRRRKR